jgi:hypothetical protein
VETPNWQTLSLPDPAARVACVDTDGQADRTAVIGLELDRGRPTVRNARSFFVSLMRADAGLPGMHLPAQCEWGPKAARCLLGGSAKRKKNKNP